MKITFLDGAGTVAGYKYLIDADDARILVGCGLFQALKNRRRRNWNPLPVGPASIQAVMALTYGK